MESGVETGINRASGAVSLLKRRVVADRGAPLPLYAQLTEGLRRLIIEDYANDERFFTEELISGELGVSLGTVRRTLADLSAEGLLERRVARGTFVRKPVLQADAAYTVGVVLPSYDSSFNSILLEGLASECRSQGVGLRVHHTQEQDEAPPGIDLSGTSARDEGFVLLSNSPLATWHLYRSLDGSGYRTVNVDTFLPGYSGSYVGVDNRAGIRMAMDHLMAMGHRDMVLLVNEPTWHENVRERIVAFRELVQEKGLGASRVVNCQRGGACAEGEALEVLCDAILDEATVDEVLAGPARPTAVLTVSDQGAWILLKRLAQRGIRVPQDISVVGFGDEGFSRFCSPDLTAVVHPYQEMTKRVIAVLRDDAAEPVHEQLLPSLLVRESTAPVS